MSDIISWLESHDKLAGWAQFLGAVLALLVTYLTAFAPVWRRKRQLSRAADRLLLRGYEVIESYNRVSAHFAPFPLSIRQASLSMSGVSDEIDRFPIFELDDQGSYSVARRLVTMGLLTGSVKLFLDDFASQLEKREVDDNDRSMLKQFLSERLDQAKLLVLGSKIERPSPPTGNGVGS